MRWQRMAWLSASLSALVKPQGTPLGQSVGALPWILLPETPNVLRFQPSINGETETVGHHSVLVDICEWREVG